jgi:hypothetical protein
VKNFSRFKYNLGRVNFDINNGKNEDQFHDFIDLKCENGFMFNTMHTEEEHCPNLENKWDGQHIHVDCIKDCVQNLSENNFYHLDSSDGVDNIDVLYDLNMDNNLENHFPNVENVGGGDIYIENLVNNINNNIGNYYQNGNQVNEDFFTGSTCSSNSILIGG